MALDGQSISTWSQRYTLTKRLLIDDAKAPFNQTTLHIGIHTFDNFNKVLIEMTIHVCTKCASGRQLIELGSMKLRTLISRLQELKAYIGGFSTWYTRTRNHAPSYGLDKNIKCHLMQFTRENETVEQRFNHMDSAVKKKSDLFETRVES